MVMMTAHGSIESAVEAMKLGARDYLQKPFEVDELLVTGAARPRGSARAHRAALPAQRARRRVQSLRHRRPQPRDPRRDRRARSWSPSRKSTVLSPARPAPARSWSRAPSTPAARSATCRSSRSTAPRFPRRCSSRSCSATCAARSPARRFTKKGRFALADGGTIFLDEIGTVGADGAGEAAARAAGARVRAARRRAHAEGRRARDRRHQPRSAADGRRGQVPRGPVLPPQRHSDRDAAAARAARRHPAARRALRPAASRSAPARRIDGVDDKAMVELTRYDWPGNVRELENTIERAVVLVDRPAADSRTVWLMGATADAGDRGLPSLQAASEPRMGRARDDPARARAGARRQEGRRRADGHQPARAQPLPAEVPHRQLRSAEDRSTEDGSADDTEDTQDTKAVGHPAHAECGCHRAATSAATDLRLP